MLSITYLFPQLKIFILTLTRISFLLKTVLKIALCFTLACVLRIKCLAHFCPTDEYSGKNTIHFTKHLETFYLVVFKFRLNLRLFSMFVATAGSTVQCKQIELFIIIIIIFSSSGDDRALTRPAQCGFRRKRK